MAGQLRGVGGGRQVAQELGALLQRLGDPPVQRGVLAGEQVAVDRLADQRVAEGVHAVGAGDQHLVGDGLARALHHVPGLEVAERLQQPVRDRPVEHGGRADHGLRRRSELLHAREQRVAQRLGQQPAVGVLARGEQLLRVEGVALGAAVEAVGELGRHPVLEDPLQLLDHLGVVEALERDALDARDALELGEQRPQRVAAVQLVGAVGDDQAQRLLARAAHEEGEEVARGGVRPVDVLEQEQDRRVAPEPLEQRQQRLEEPALARAVLLVGGLAGRGAAELRQQLPQRVAGRGREVGHELGAVAGDRPQRGDERRVGDLHAAELQAVAAQDVRLARARARLELGEQAGLADAGLAADEDHRGLAAGRAVEPGLEDGQLGGPPDERR